MVVSCDSGNSATMSSNDIWTLNAASLGFDDVLMESKIPSAADAGETMLDTRSSRTLVQSRGAFPPALAFRLNH
jgi:C4-dicarboxylate transporter